MAIGPQFAECLKGWRQSEGVKQLVGRRVGLGKGVWESYEQGKRLPNLRTLFSMPRKLAAEFPDKRVPSQGELLEAWLAAQDVGAEEELLAVLRQLGARRASLANLSWLNANVFTGERREERARTRLDCLVNAAAISDLKYLLQLGLDPATELTVDKELTTRRSWDELVQHYGSRDVVSISSGAVNAMTALLIDGMVFRMDAMAEARRAYRRLVTDMGHLETDPQQLQAFQACLAAADRLGSSADPALLLTEAGLPSGLQTVAEDVAGLLRGSTPSQVASFFRQGILDPIMRKRFQPEQGDDYAVVSFARHPFGAPDKVALVIAGTNGPATSAALWLLATQGIEDWPLGAVMRVGGVRANGLPNVEVVTKRYKPTDIPASIDEVLKTGPDGERTIPRGEFGNWTDDELRKWKELAVSLAKVLAER